LPPAEGNPFGDLPQFIDLRQITPITVPYFQEGSKVASLSKTAILAMQAHLGMFFSGLVVYVQPIPCPKCNHPIDPAEFVTASAEEPDVDE
jgi:hypothetical protein